MADKLRFCYAHTDTMCDSSADPERPKDIDLAYPFRGQNVTEQHREKPQGPLKSLGVPCHAGPPRHRRVDQHCFFHEPDQGTAPR